MRSGSQSLLADWRINQMWQMCKEDVGQKRSRTIVPALRACFIYLGRAAQYILRISYGVGYTWNKNSGRRSQRGLELTKKTFMKKVSLRWLKKAKGSDRQRQWNRMFKMGDTTQKYGSREWCVRWGKPCGEPLEERGLPISGGWGPCDKTTQTGRSIQRSLRLKPMARERHLM